MKVQEFYDAPTFTLSYLVFDEDTKDAVVIDSILNYDPKGSKISFESVNQLLSEIETKNLKVHYVLETHAHADHLTAAQVLKEKLPEVETAIHKNIQIVQETFKGVFNFGDDFDTTGKSFDLLLEDEQVLEAGTLKIKVLHTPGHTPACVSFLINEQALFTGDALFMPDFGTGRCDFPAGSAEDLYDSVHDKIYELDDSVEVYVGHDYQPNGRELAFKTTIGEQKEKNIQLTQSTSREDFVSCRKKRDANLAPPRLLLPSVQVNIQNGKLPPAEENEVSYLKIPIRF